MFTDFFDDSYFGKYENMTERNIQSFRKFVRARITERREMLKDENFKNTNFDFLTLVLQIEHFAMSDESIESHCVGFFFGSTQSATNLQSNLLIYATMFKEVKQKVRNEMKEKLNPGFNMNFE